MVNEFPTQCWQWVRTNPVHGVSMSNLKNQVTTLLGLAICWDAFIPQILSWWVQLQHYLRQKVLGINAAMKHAFKDVFRFVTFLFIISCFLWWGRSSGVPLLRQTLKSHTIPPGLVGRHFQGSPGPKPCSKQGHSKFLISQPKILLLLSRNQHKHSNWISLGAKSADWGWGHRVCSSFVTDKVVWGQPNLCLSPAS